MIPMCGSRVSPPARQLASMIVRHPPFGRIVPGLGQLEQKTDICPNEHALLSNGTMTAWQAPETFGVGEGNRTLVFSLEVSGFS